MESVKGSKQKDQYGRVIDYLRISVTDRCNLRCCYCMPVEGICKKTHNDIIRIEEIISFVKVAASEGIRKIRITGGEPLVRKGIVSLIKAIGSIDGIEDISMTTNGTLLVDEVKALSEAGLSRINISLDTLDGIKYNEMTRGGRIEEVFAGIEAAKSYGLKPIKINTVLIGGFNDMEIDDFLVFAKDNDLEWRVIELMPIGEVSHWSMNHFVSGKDLFDNHPELICEDFDHYRRVKEYRHVKYDTKVGLIDTLSGKFCESCNRIRLTSDGKIKPCLHSDLEYDIRPYLGDEEAMKTFYKEVLLRKPKEHSITDNNYEPVKRNMNQIGG